MRKQDDFNWDDKSSTLQYAGMIAIIVVLLCGILALGYYIFFEGKDAETSESNVTIGESVDSENGIQNVISGSSGGMKDSLGTSEQKSEHVMGAESYTSENIKQLPDDASASEDPQSGENQISGEIGAEADISELEGDADWIASELEKSYKVWVSWYPSVPYPVDVNVAYFGYEGENAAQNQIARYRSQLHILRILNIHKNLLIFSD